MGVERKFRIPRIWSNDELSKRIAPLMKGIGCRLFQAGTDQDKQGNTYKEYFTGASWISY